METRSVSAQHTDDWALLERARGDDLTAIGSLFERHRNYVYRIAWGYVGGRGGLAEDVLQEVFLRVTQGRQRFLRRAAFRTLLYRVTLNVARELLRKTTREVLEGSLADLERGGPRFVPQETAGDLVRHLTKLPKRQREVVILRLLEGMNTRETAQLMGCSTGSIKTHLHRALARLRKLMSVEEPESAVRRSVRSTDRR